MQSASTTARSAAGLAEEQRRTTLPRPALWGTVIGMVIMLAVFVFAIVMAAHEASALGWILAGIAAGWLALGVYGVILARRTLDYNRAGFAEKRRLNGADDRGTGSVRDQKLAHSFQIVKVQNNVLREELAKGPEADQETIQRSLDTIDFTAKNGMGLAHSKEQPAAQAPA